MDKYSEILIYWGHINLLMNFEGVWRGGGAGVEVDNMNLLYTFEHGW